MLKIKEPRKIEARSFEIIEGFLKNAEFSGPQKAIVKRVIHTTVDKAYAKDLVFSAHAIEKGISALRSAGNIVVDSSMVKAGINKVISAGFKNKIICHMHDKDVQKKALNNNITKAAASMRKSKKEIEWGVVAIGNAPTALFEICEIIKYALVKPAVVIGVPVGFVGAVESKRMLRKLDVEYISNKSRRGGSTVAAAIVNALLILAKDK